MSLLAKLRLDGFFEDHNIPPILFPIAVIVLIVLIVIMLQPPAEVVSEVEACGDGVCDSLIGEDLKSCPDDCGETEVKTREVLVKIGGDVKSSVEIRLEDADGKLIKSYSGKKNEFLFSGITSESVKAILTNPANNQYVSSDLTRLKDDLTTIEIWPLQSFFEVPDDEEETGPTTGTLKISVRDSDTNQLVNAKVTIVIPNGASNIPVTQRQVSGTEYITLAADEWYYILAEAPGYKPYSSSTQIRLEVGKEREYIVSMELLDGAREAPLEVCLLNQTGGVPASGKIIISDSGGYSMGVSNIDSTGCANFSLTADIIVTASTTDLPADCVDETSLPLTLAAADNDLTLVVNCGVLGQVRVKVIGENSTLLTSDASITAWYADDTQIPGTGSNNVLAEGTEGYTEFISVYPATPFYFTIADLDGYETHRTGKYNVGPNETKSFTVTLSPIPPPEPNFTFQISYPNPVSVEEEFTVSIKKVLYGQDDVTKDVNMSVQIAGENCTVVKQSGWVATCTAPMEIGEADISIMALYNGKRGSTVKQVEVLEVGSSSYFRVSMRSILFNDPPVELIFDVTFNNTPAEGLDEMSLYVFYEDGGIVFEENHAITVEGSGVYSAEIDSPYPGEHRADLYLKKITATAIYEYTYTAFFEVEPKSVQVTTEETLSPQIVVPDEDFVTYVRVLYNNKEIADLENVYATLDDDTSRLNWESKQHVYTKTFQGPDREGIYPVVFELGTQDLSSLDLYVIDTSKPRSQECEINECESLADVRECVRQHKEEDLYSESDVISCIEMGWRTGGCSSGDLDGDSILSDDDVDYLDEILDAIDSDGVPPSGTDEDCADVNDDDYLTDEDMECLEGLLSGSYSSYLDCPQCEPSSPMEICHDGQDNDCDGQKDKENYDNDAEEPYDSDLCVCSQDTPCDMKYDEDGLPSTEVYSYCRNVSWVGYWSWIQNEHITTILESDAGCTLSANCQWWQCEDEFHVCSKDSSGAKWFDASEPDDSDIGKACSPVTTSTTSSAGSYDECCTDGCAYGTVNCDCYSDCGTAGYSCHACGGADYNMSTGRFGTDLPCEGSAYYTVADQALCDDGWDNNCDGQDWPCIYY